MAFKKAIVLGADGRLEQLQSGDTLTGNLDQITLTADAVLVPGNAVYASAADHVDKARANAAGTKDVLGLAGGAIGSGATGSVQTDGVLTLTTAQWDAVAGTTGGLAFGTPYFLDPATAGKITATPPSTAGQYVCEIGLGLSTTELEIRVQPPILL